MTKTSWLDLGATGPKELVHTREELHWATQPLGQIGATFQEARPDWLHYTVRWDSEEQGFVSDWAKVNKPFRLKLNLASFALELHTKDTAISFDLEKKSLKASYDWLLTQISGFLDREVKLDEIPHDMPEHSLQTGAVFERDIAAIKELQHWYHNAQVLLSEVQASFPNQPPLVCWPHHFDLATLQKLDGIKSGEINAGFSPGDDNYKEPYFYVTAWPHMDLKDIDDASSSTDLLPQLPGGGHWHTQGWLGAILTGSHLLTQENQETAARQFLHAAVIACKNIAEASSTEVSNDSQEEA